MLLALPDFVYAVAPPLYAARARGHDQDLTQRVRVPRRPGAGIKDNPGTGHPRRRIGSERRIDPRSACEIGVRSRSGRLRGASRDPDRALFRRWLAQGN